MLYDLQPIFWKQGILSHGANKAMLFVEPGHLLFVQDAKVKEVAQAILLGNHIYLHHNF